MEGLEGPIPVMSAAVKGLNGELSPLSATNRIGIPPPFRLR